MRGQKSVSGGGVAPATDLTGARGHCPQHWHVLGKPAQKILRLGGEILGDKPLKFGVEETVLIRHLQNM